MAENICKQSNRQRINFQNIQATHGAQYQKTNHPIKTWAEALNRHLFKGIETCKISCIPNPHPVRASREENPSGHTGVICTNTITRYLRSPAASSKGQPIPAHCTPGLRTASGEEKESLPELPIRWSHTLSNLNPSCCSFSPFPLALSSVEFENG